VLVVAHVFFSGQLRIAPRVVTRRRTEGDRSEYIGCVKRTLITGMSGTGKSSLIEELQRRGYEAVDLDSPVWSEWKAIAGEGQQVSEAQPEWVWREDKIAALLEQPRNAPLFVSGCASNQGQFYPRLETIVLLSAPTKTILARVASRSNNHYGKSQAERESILQNITDIEPLLRSGCDLEFDTALYTVERLADELEQLVTPRLEPR
jgi:broad-specificity NMP kinase